MSTPPVFYNYLAPAKFLNTIKEGKELNVDNLSSALLANAEVLEQLIKKIR